MGPNYQGLPFTIAEKWGRVLGIHVAEFKTMQQMIDFMDPEFVKRHDYGVYLLQGPKQKIGHYYVRHSSLSELSVADPEPQKGLFDIPWRDPTTVPDYALSLQ